MPPPPDPGSADQTVSAAMVSSLHFSQYKHVTGFDISIAKEMTSSPWYSIVVI